MTENSHADWRSFLLEWSGEWADSRPDGEAGDEEEAARRARWLGFPPASEERIAALEQRLGRRMPPSYREFLKVSDGWRHAGGFVSLLAGTADARWHDDESGLAVMFEEYLDEGCATLEQVRVGTYQYTSAGPFGEAVEQARELARWGDTDGAWRALRDALPSWEPPGPDLLAPLGWLADPVLGPVLTPERGRELLSTPRGGQSGRAPRPTAGLDPDGLAWLAEPDPGNNRTSYRFVLVEGVEPEELPARLADEGDAVLNEPMTLWDARHRLPRNRREFSSYEDKALMAVGRAGAGWSFAFDGDPGAFDRSRFVSPAAAAGAGTRAVVVWSGLRAWHGEPSFHLSVALDGIEQYAFTYADGELQHSGDIPPALAPSRFFGTPDGTGRERALLEAVSGEFGVRLPRRAITHGRLHTFTSRSWTRPPRDGETYAVIRML
jgi:hypothetical protein